MTGLLTVLLAGCPASIAPAGPVEIVGETLVTGKQTSQYRATDQSGQTATVKWTASAGTINANGTLEPPTKSGPITITARSSDGQKLGSLTVMIDALDASISGTLFEDRNNDHQRNTDEPALAGWPVIVQGISATQYALRKTTTTDAQGQYHLTGLPSGNYRITHSPRLGTQHSSSTDQTSSATVSGTTTASNLSSSNLHTKIVGGQTTSPGQWPFVVALVRRDVTDPKLGLHCGATLIASQWLVTAAHCVTNGSSTIATSTYQAILGGRDLEPNAPRNNISRIIIHPDFDTNSLKNDIALMQLEQPASSAAISVVNAGEPELVLANRNSTVLGWGALDENATFATNSSKTLQAATLPLVGNATCAQAFRGLTSIENDVICAGPESGGIDACQGDSGGPLIVTDTSGLQRLVGIVSKGYGCARKGYYGIYSRVPTFEAWLNATLGSAQPAEVSKAITPGEGIENVSFALQPKL
jgi:Trypsin/SdrD B-like domain